MHAIYGLFAQGVIVAMIIRFVREIFGRKNLAPLGIELWIPAAIVLIVPIAGVSLAGHLRGLWGDPSIVTFLLLFLYTVHPSSLPNRPRLSTSVLVSLFVMLPLYLPLFLLNQNLPVDLYAIGWHPKLILIAIAVIAFGCVIMRRMEPRWTNIIAIALIASSTGLMESNNLWDYLVDPGLLFTIALLAIAGSITSFLSSRMHESIKNLSSGKQT
ncbi:MAG: hypothetical protein WCL33_04370 [Planctomycetota bacterium]|nr:hypothetical protein [Planctomycetota bacterium]